MSNIFVIKIVLILYVGISITRKATNASAAQALRVHIAKKSMPVLQVRVPTMGFASTFLRGTKEIHINVFALMVSIIGENFAFIYKIRFRIQSRSTLFRHQI